MNINNSFVITEWSEKTFEQRQNYYIITRWERSNHTLFWIKL